MTSAVNSKRGVSSETPFLRFIVKRILFIYLLISSVSYAQSEKTVFNFIGKTMGTTYSVKTTSLPPVDLQSLIDSKLEDVNDQMSTYRKDSELSRFNQQKSTKWFSVSKETASVAYEAEQISKKTEGAFDSTIGKLVNRWGFGPDGRATKIPSDNFIKEHLENSGWNKVKVRLDPPALKKSNKDLYVDYSGIAKGFGVDQIADLLESYGIHDYMVEVGGEIRTAGSKYGSAWKIAIEVPENGRHIFSVIQLHDAALATSGDYRNYREENGERLSHLIDPTTGKPIKHKLASVSVIAESSMKSDAWATALMILGEKEGLRLAKANKIKIFMIIRDALAFAAL